MYTLFVYREPEFLDYPRKSSCRDTGIARTSGEIEF